MNRKSKVVLILALIVLIVIIIIVAMIISKQQKKEELMNEVTWTTQEVTENRESINLDRYEYNNVVSSVQAYLNYLNVNNTAYFRNDGTKAYTDKEINEIIYNLLSENYLNNNKNITINNIDKYIKKYNEQTVFIPINMKCVKKDDISTYVVEGIIEKLDYNVLDTKRFIININTSKMNFSVEPTEKEYNELVSLEATNVNIQEYTYNKISSKKVNAENISTDYFTRFKRLCLSAPEVAYKYLDEEYKNVRFGNIDNFKKYILDNQEVLKTDTIDKYLVNVKDNITEYVCMNQYQNTYMFDEKSPMEYTVKLDTYTITTDKFKTEYKKGNDQTKVLMNINKFILMINNQDFSAAYNVLDQTFRDNYFKTQDIFEDYVKRNMYRYNEIQFGQFENNGNVYVCEASLSDLTEGKYKDETKGTGGSGYIYSWKFMMQLKEDTDFVMSFEVSE